MRTPAVNDIWKSKYEGAKRDGYDEYRVKSILFCYLNKRATVIFESPLNLCVYAMQLDEWLEEMTPTRTEGQFYIWNTAQGQWWKSDDNGYTSRLDDAGLYSESKAAEILAAANIDSIIRESAVPEYMARLLADRDQELAIEHAEAIGEED